MTFEEFFNKKKIDLVQLKAALPGLYVEFEQHYALMGEKSFDHTKKYWFNDLRRKYPLMQEPKVEKVIFENKVAEQTVAQSITGDGTEKSQAGYKPKFSSGVNASPLAPATGENEPDIVDGPKAVPNQPLPQLGFKPKFKPPIKPAGDKA